MSRTKTSRSRGTNPRVSWTQRNTVLTTKGTKEQEKIKNMSQRIFAFHAMIRWLVFYYFFFFIFCITFVLFVFFVVNISPVFPLRLRAFALNRSPVLNFYLFPFVFYLVAMVFLLIRGFVNRNREISLKQGGNVNFWNSGTGTMNAKLTGIGRVSSKVLKF